MLALRNNRLKLSVDAPVNMQCLENSTYAGNYRYCITPSVCKGNQRYYFLYDAGIDTVSILHSKAGAEEKLRKYNLSIKGNVLYDLLYRSNIDTPFAQINLYQHTVQTYLDITWKNNYPFRLYLTNRFGNAPLFQNFSDINFQYSPQDFINKIKTQLVTKALQTIKADSLVALKKEYEQQLQQYQLLQQWLKSPVQLQRLILEKEEELKKKALEIPGLNIAQPPQDEKEWKTMTTQFSGKFKMNIPVDSSRYLRATDSVLKRKERFDAVYKKKQLELDSLLITVKKADSVYQVAKKWQVEDSNKLIKEIEEIKSVQALKQKLQQLQLPDSLLPKGFQKLYAVKSLDIGRGIIDYSELSAKNISVTGLHLEYNPRNYYAIAAGVVDYQFRDYIVRNPYRQKQYLALVRTGKGNKEGSHVFVTYYTGRRQLYNAVSISSLGGIPNCNLMGVTVEARYRLGDNSYVVSEIAKSSLPYYSLDSVKRKGLAENMFDIKNRTNEAYAIKLHIYVPILQTTIDGSIRRMGANFQSFSLFTTGAKQTAWSVRVEQPFFKRKLMVVAAIRENDFVNNFTNTLFRSNTVLKSIQATLRTKKWPVLSAGYFPSSQLTRLSDERFTETFFYTLTGSISHFYKIKQAQANSMLVYTQFYNKANDSGFIYFNARNVLFSQSFFLNKTSLHSNAALAANPYYQLYTLEQNFTTAINKWLRVGAGVKYNRQSVLNNVQWGYSGNVKIKIPVLGDIQVMADKGYIPGPNRQLVENNMGRVTYFKMF